MEFYVLASGSEGNCSVIKTRQSLLIIDCGMSWRYLANEFARYAIDCQKADALLVTHTHSDHIAQLNRFRGIPKYAAFELPESQKVDFYRPFTINELTILPLPLSHDCPDTTGYLIRDDKEALVYITDTGYLSQNNARYLENADYYIMESNHDENLLLNTSRPHSLKQRILRDDGHLSNVACACYLAELVGKRTKEVVLAHLSKEANRPELALSTLNEIWEERKLAHKKIKVTVASQNSSCKGGKL